MSHLFKLFTAGLKVTSILLAPKKIAYLTVGAQNCLLRGNNFKLGLGFHIDALQEKYNTTLKHQSKL